MLTWGKFRETRPDLAEAGQQLFYQFGVGLAFLGTVRPDGGPRMHPMCPVIVQDAPQGAPPIDGLYAFIEPGPKRRDLLRDGRYALHCFPPANNEDAFYITGNAEHRTDPALREKVAAVFWSERGQESPPPQSEEQQLFEFFVQACLYTKTSGHGDWNPQHTIWRARG